MARSKSKKSKRKPTHPPQHDRFTGLKKRLEETLPQAKLTTSPAGAIKMADVLSAFIEPYRTYADTTEAYRRLLLLGTLAWNASLLPAHQQETMITEVLAAGIPAGDQALLTEGREVIYQLIERKQCYFAQYTRTIITFDLTETKAGYHLSVASTVK